MHRHYDPNRKTPHRRACGCRSALLADRARPGAPTPSPTGTAARRPRLSSTPGNRRPPRCGFAMVQGAVYDAVNAMIAAIAPTSPSPRPPPDSKDARPRPRRSTSSSPSSRPSSQRCSRCRHVARRSQDTPRGAKAAGIAAGDAAAAAMLAARADDGRFGPFTPVIGTTPASGARRRRFRRRPHSLGRERTTVPGPRRRDAPHRRAERPDEPRLRKGPQRGQEDRRTQQHHPNRGSDRRRDLLARPRLRPLEPRVPHPRRFRHLTSSTAHGSSRARTWPPPMPRSAAGTTSTTGTPGARSPPSARPRATETGQPRPTRHGHRCSIRPRR